MRPPQPPIVVLGAGIIGSSVAYQLALQGTPCVIVDEHRPAGCASGKAAGFLAAEWGERSTAALSRLSFEMHAELAQTLNLQSYRRLPTLDVRRRGDDGYRKDSEAEALEVSWLDGAAEAEAVLLDADTAQVDPAELSGALLEAATARGATLVTDEAVGLELEPLSEEEREEEGPRGASRRVAGVRLRDGGRLAASQVVAAMGPWTCKLEDWAGRPSTVKTASATAQAGCYSDPGGSLGSLEARGDPRTSPPAAPSLRTLPRVPRRRARAARGRVADG